AAQRAHRVTAEHLRRRDPAAAITHALAGGDPALAARVLGAHWPDLLVAGEVGTIERMRDRIPAPFDCDPDVLLALAAARAVDEPGDGPGGEDRSVAAVIDLVRHLLVLRRPDDASWLRGAALVDASDLPDTARAVGQYLVGRAELLRPGGEGAAAGRLEQASALARSRGWPALDIACRAERSWALVRAGDLRGGALHAEAAVTDAREHGWCGSSTVAAAHLARGTVAYWRDRLDEAATALTEAADAATGTRPDLLLQVAAVTALVRLAQGDADGLARAHALLADFPPDLVDGDAARAVLRFVAAMEAEARGDLTTALADLAVPEGSPRTAVLVWQAEAQRRSNDPEAAWGRIAEAEVQGGLPAHVRVALHATEALLLADQGLVPAAHTALERALDDAAPLGLVRPLRRRAADLHDLLSAHLEWGGAHDELVARLLVAEQRCPAPRASAWELTEREREVLGCLRSSLTSEEIAASLFVSVNTVKTHMRAIYRKLGADGRRQAVRTAVQRGLL
ncbi:LuxR family transcriptional regulator, partial [Cellulomonas triticagri]